MKKIFTLMAAFVVAMAASAQETSVSASFNPESKTLSFILNDNDPAYEVYAVGFKFDLPEGVEVSKYFDEDEEEWVLSINKGARCKASHTLLKDKTTTGWSINIYNAASTFKSDKTQSVCDVVLTEAKGTVKVHSINFANKETVAKFQDGEVLVNLDGTGINGISAEKAENAAIYNLAGQRVNKAVRGIFIQNGKKIMK